MVCTLKWCLVSWKVTFSAERVPFQLFLNICSLKWQLSHLFIEIMLSLLILIPQLMNTEQLLLPVGEKVLFKHCSRTLLKSRLCKKMGFTHFQAHFRQFSRNPPQLSLAIHTYTHHLFWVLNWWHSALRSSVIYCTSNVMYVSKRLFELFKHKTLDWP